MNTIRKNAHRKIKGICESITKIVVYSLDSGFVGVEHKPADYYAVKKHGGLYEWIKDELGHRSSRLSCGKHGRYCLHIHSNLWIDLIAGPKK